MKTTITLNDFLNAWQSSDSRKDSFSRAGLIALWDYLEELEEEGCLGEDFDPLDIVALDCEWMEYDNLGDFNVDYNTADHFENWEQVAENTQVIKFGEGKAIVGQY